ncbi:MAG TPA: histidine kinase dimerization/phospho-acceptor domain-containing protein [Verrucomicrobiae bacterium]|nr:histidine kinase dimerization/phospho-acceptor domain-containing protein [Verrucomicrobiae bacterium]
MSSFDSIYKKMASSLEQGGAGNPHEPAHTFDFSRHVAPAVAHELNNIFTIIQGYADRLLLQHGADPTMQPHLKLISDATKRASLIVRDATPPPAGGSFRKNPPPAPDA